MSVGERRSSRPRAQHFLRSSAFAAELVRAAGIRPGELVLDIGAGRGLLTAALVRAGARVQAIELDPRLAADLRRRFPDVVQADALHAPLPRQPFRVVANLPFASGTAILRRLLDPAVPLQSADLIVEWGLAAKRTSVWPSTQLGIDWSVWHELALVRRVPRCCFAPPPSVDAAVLRAVRRERPFVAPEAAREFRGFLARGFRDGLRGVLTPKQLKRAATELGFDARANPRDLDARQWTALYVRRRGYSPTRHEPL
ncbi:MAG: methyltransferase domain-containing protein [Actinobacteria bacterium]|nr:MAG: methyltransferase domain-containing protein [Actinomycetota bacterium]